MRVQLLPRDPTSVYLRQRSYCPGYQSQTERAPERNELNRSNAKDIPPWEKVSYPTSLYTPRCALRRAADGFGKCWVHRVSGFLCGWASPARSSAQVCWEFPRGDHQRWWRDSSDYGTLKIFLLNFNFLFKICKHKSRKRSICWHLAPTTNILTFLFHLFLPPLLCFVGGF